MPGATSSALAASRNALFSKAPFKAFLIKGVLPNFHVPLFHEMNPEFHETRASEAPRAQPTRPSSALQRCKTIAGQHVRMMIALQEVIKLGQPYHQPCGAVLI